MQKMKDDRKAILSRIKRALKTPAPRPHQAGSTPSLKTDAPKFENQLPIIGQQDFQQWLPPVGEGPEERLALFASNAADLMADFILCESEEDLKTKLAALKNECGWTRLASHNGEFTSGVLPALALPCLFTDEAYDVSELEKCDAGISECEALIAQTGSVLVTNRSSGGRALSVLPPHHVVLARREQLLPDLSAAFALLQEKYAKNYPTMMSLITGPSRTGDIERILVLGAHGPKCLTIFCV
jgi:L-lactate dehydrogenase complex protein LldG